MAASAYFLFLSSVALCFAHDNVPASLDECVSQQEFETLKYDLDYWQNVTLTFMKNNIASEKDKKNACIDKIKAMQESLNTSFDDVLSAIRADSTTSLNEYDCATFLYVIAFTSDIGNAGSDDCPSITVRLTTGEEQTYHLYDRPGDDMNPNKGDLWKLLMSSFGFTTDSCVTKSDISQVKIIEGGNDGWNIESIMTVLHSGAVFDILTANFHVNRWTDSDDQASHREYILTKV